jgi:hypothetical protein
LEVFSNSLKLAMFLPGGLAGAKLIDGSVGYAPDLLDRPVRRKCINLLFDADI